MPKQKNDSFSLWKGVETEIFSQEELDATSLRDSFLKKLVQARKERGFSQKKLEALSGVEKTTIARIERGVSAPNLMTILKILAALGKTLSVTEIEKK
ncbi:MAG: helix-turn-helix domain-containing protein [Acidaminococcaceae bacterium]|nr:helix-turn-helix domain-containing protein [Acidaminococcaceae bacterium]